MNEQPVTQAMENFWVEARRHCPELPDTFTCRQIGSQPAINAAILDAIASGNKTGTVSLPEIYRQLDRPRPAVGDGIIFQDAEGAAARAVMITNIDDVPYGQITEQHTSLDGPRVRALDAWQATHKGWFDSVLAPYNQRCDDDTIIAFETFRVCYPPLAQDR
ncbi:MAG: ASCH domain-containing protein [Pseudomonadota bacterium]